MLTIIPLNGGDGVRDWGIHTRTRTRTHAHTHTHTHHPFLRPTPPPVKSNTVRRELHAGSPPVCRATESVSLSAIWQWQTASHFQKNSCPVDAVRLLAGPRLRPRGLFVSLLCGLWNLLLRLRGERWQFNLAPPPPKKCKASPPFFVLLFFF